VIPTEIPPALRSAAIVPEFAHENEAAWTHEGALQVLDALEWSKVAVIGAVGCGEIGGQVVPTKQSWTFHETVGETETSRAQRSRDDAGRFIRGLSGVVPFVLLEFSYQDDAA
jgi:hypothetical protein